MGISPGISWWENEKVPATRETHNQEDISHSFSNGSDGSPNNDGSVSGGTTPDWDSPGVHMLGLLFKL